MKGRIRSFLTRSNRRTKRRRTGRRKRRVLPRHKWEPLLLLMTVKTMRTETRMGPLRNNPFQVEWLLKPTRSLISGRRFLMRRRKSTSFPNTITKADPGSTRLSLSAPKLGIDSSLMMKGNRYLSTLRGALKMASKGSSSASALKRDCGLNSNSSKPCDL